MIVKNKVRQSIFITDFELAKENSSSSGIQLDQFGNTSIRTDIDPSPWATQQFEEWITSGNSIDIFAKEFSKQEGTIKQDQHLYFILFTPEILVEILPSNPYFSA